MREDLCRNKTTFFQIEKELCSRIEACTKVNFAREKLMAQEPSPIEFYEVSIKASGSMAKWLSGLSKISIMHFKAISRKT